MKNLFISFSGGETSAFMTIWLLKNMRQFYADVVIVFANTGKENEETLEFVQKCSEEFGFPVVWVEAVVHHGSKTGTTHKVVSFETASRDGEPFEEVIKKYGIPNAGWLHCTRELKTNPLYSYIRSIGWKKGTFETAIGMRVDEIGRANEKAAEIGIIYPLITDYPATKPMINEWWEKQSFRLPLKGYQGNCDFCWKKSLRKHLTIIKEKPEVFDWPERMESLYGRAGKIADDEEDRVFFRNRMSAKDLRLIASTGQFAPAEDDARVYPEPDLFGFKLDIQSACAQSCEVAFDDFEDAP